MGFTCSKCCSRTFGGAKEAQPLLDQTSKSFSAAGAKEDIGLDLPPVKEDDNTLGPNGALLYYAQRGDVTGIRKRLEEGADINVTDEKVMQERDEALAKKGEEERTENRPIAGDTALHIAAGNGHLEAVQELLQMRASLEIPNRLGSTVLHRAVCGGHRDVIHRLLDERASLAAYNKIGNTPLHCAAITGDLDVVQTLLERNATLFVHQQNIVGFTPLAYASQHNKTIAKLLQDAKPPRIDKRKALLYQPDEEKLEQQSASWVSAHEPGPLKSVPESPTPQMNGVHHGTEISPAHSDSFGGWRDESPASMHRTISPTFPKGAGVGLSNPIVSEG